MAVSCNDTRYGEVVITGFRHMRVNGAWRVTLSFVDGDVGSSTVATITEEGVGHGDEEPGASR